VQSPPLIESTDDSAPAQIQSFYAHTIVLKTFAKGSILDLLCDEELPVPIFDVTPTVFRIMLDHVHGGKISVDVLKNCVEADGRSGDQQNASRVQKFEE